MSWTKSQAGTSDTRNDWRQWRWRQFSEICTVIIRVMMSTWQGRTNRVYSWFSVNLSLFVYQSIRHIRRWVRNYLIDWDQYYSSSFSECWLQSYQQRKCLRLYFPSWMMMMVCFTNRMKMCKFVDIVLQLQNFCENPSVLALASTQIIKHLHFPQKFTIT